MEAIALTDSQRSPRQERRTLARGTSGISRWCADWTINLPTRGVIIYSSSCSNFVGLVLPEKRSLDTLQSLILSAIMLEMH